jgi:hypothetical protein
LLTFLQLRLEIEEGLVDLVLALQIDEEHVDESAGLLLVPAPSLFLLEFEGEALRGRRSTWRWVELGWAWFLR